MGLTLVEKIAGRHADGLAPGTVVRSGDFVRELLAQSQDANEYAFALGALVAPGITLVSACVKS